MTVSELYASVAQLGFETTLEDNERFFYAANRAILRINALRPLKGVYVLHHKPPDNLLANASFSPTEVYGEVIYTAYGAKAYYFETDGNGVAYLEVNEEGTADWTVIDHIEFSRSARFAAYRGFVKRDGAFFGGSVRLRFTGEYLYSIRSVAMYRYIYSADPADIPAYEAYSRYDISALVPDFLGLDAPPIKEEADRTQLSQGYDVENGRVLLLSRDKKGLYKISYLRKPQALVYTDEPVDDLTPIPLDEDLCALLPFLIASTLWADDEPEKAQYYMQIYRERAVEVERKNARTVKPAAIRSVNNW